MIQDSIQKTIEGLQGICAEIQILQGRINELETAKKENDDFLYELELLIKQRRKEY